MSELHNMFFYAPRLFLMDFNMLKVCIKCNIEKDISNFYKRSSVYWVELKCKVCVCEWRKSERERSMARVNDNKRSWTKERLDYLTANTRQFRINNPEKYKAHQLIRSWVRKNKDIVPQCSFISWEQWPLHFHHFDYTKPYHVVPCTPLEHSSIHSGKIAIEDKHIFICT